jgi:carbon monoxide dehydrogenase subunit G
MIDREILIEAPVEVVWRTITEPELHAQRQPGCQPGCQPG